MGMLTGNYSGNPTPREIGGGVFENEVQGLTVERMSTVIVSVMEALGTYEAINDLLLYEDMTPLDNDKSRPIYDGEKITGQQVFDEGLVYKQGSKYQRIFPYPFNPEAQESDSVFIRVYYAEGRNDSSGKIVQGRLHIDIVCSMDYWVINDNAHKLPLIRPYAIMSRINERIGKNNTFGYNLGNPSGFMHLAVNQRFESLRLYYNTNDIGLNG